MSASAEFSALRARLAYRAQAKRWKNLKARFRKALPWVGWILFALLAVRAASAQLPNVNIDRVGGTKVTSSIPVSGTVTATLGGTVTVDITKILGASPGATNFIPVRLTNGTSYFDPTQIRALTSSDQVTIANASLAVTGTFWQATQPISGTVTVTDGAGALNVIVDSGTVTTITNPVTVTDGAGALNVIVDSGAINATLQAGSAAIGKLAANSGVDIGDVDVTSVSGNVTVVQGTGTNLHETGAKLLPIPSRVSRLCHSQLSAEA